MDATPKAPLPNKPLNAMLPPESLHPSNKPKMAGVAGSGSASPSAVGSAVSLSKMLDEMTEPDDLAVLLQEEEHVAHQSGKLESGSNASLVQGSNENLPELEEEYLIEEAEPDRPVSPVEETPEEYLVNPIEEWPQAASEDHLELEYKFNPEEEFEEGASEDHFGLPAEEEHPIFPFPSEDQLQRPVSPSEEWSEEASELFLEWEGSEFEFGESKEASEMDLNESEEDVNEFLLWDSTIHASVTASVPPSQSQVTVIRPRKKKKVGKRKVKIPKEVLKRWYRKRFEEIMQETVRRNKEEETSRLENIKKFKTQMLHKKCDELTDPRKWKKAGMPSETEGEELEDVEEVAGGVSQLELGESPAPETQVQAPDEEAAANTAVAVDRPEEEEFEGDEAISIASEASPRPSIALTEDEKRIEDLFRQLDEAIDKYIQSRLERKSSSDLGSALSSKSSSLSSYSYSSERFTSSTPSQVLRREKAKFRLNGRKNARELIEEILATSLFDGLRGSDDDLVEELWRASGFDYEDDDEELRELGLLGGPGIFDNLDDGTGAYHRLPSKQVRKLFRKEGSLLDQVGQQLGVYRSRRPNKWMVVWGAGLMLGTMKSQLANLFRPPPDKINFYIDKPYCTLRFTSIRDARKARWEHTGRPAFGNQMLFVGYLTREPPYEDPRLLAPFNTLPRGLGLLENFISEKDEASMLAEIIRLRSQDKGKDLKHRWVRHYGYEFNYDTNNVDENSPMPEPIPAYLDPLITRMINTGVFQHRPDQLTINAYKPGQGIPPHVDTHSAFDCPIVSLSLWSDLVMDFRYENLFKSVKLPRRSLLVLDGMSRYAYKHGIASRTCDFVPDKKYGGVTSLIRKERISLTFRLLRSPKECYCLYPQLCDTQQGKITEEMAAKLEKELVHNVYEEIATHFSCTRHTPWPRVKEFVESLAAGNSLLDVGCGNGKYFNIGEYIYQVGTDMSKGLLEIARSKTSVDGIQANCLKLPFKNGTFEAVICIAVLHHLCTEERRKEAVSELLRVMRPGAEGLIYVWAKDQRANEIKSVYARQRERKTELFSLQKKCEVAKNYSFLPVHDHEADFAQSDMLVPWITKQGKQGEECATATVHHRFYHVFEKGELEVLLKKFDPAPRIIDSYYDQGNWCVRFQKEEKQDPHAAATATKTDDACKIKEWKPVAKCFTP